MARARTVGMKDVARAAGVSVGTVSNVLNRPEIVSEDRRRAVQAAIRHLGYVRNDAARQLKVGRSRTIGAIVLDSGNPFYAQLAHGMEAAAEASGLAVMVGSSGGREAREQLYLSLFEEQRVRGILLASTGGHADLVTAIRERGTPVVLVEQARADGTSGSSVGVDHVAGGELAVRHLLSSGRRRPAIVLAQQELSQVSARLEGARRAAAAAGCELEVIRTAGLDVLAGRAVGEEIADRRPAERPDALFCVNDLLAVGVLQAFAYGGGVDVPRDVALIGYDDIAFARSTVVPLSSIAQPAELMGRTALALLEEEIAESDAPGRQVSFRPELVVRASSGA